LGENRNCLNGFLSGLEEGVQQCQKIHYVNCKSEVIGKPCSQEGKEFDLRGKNFPKVHAQNFDKREQPVAAKKDPDKKANRKNADRKGKPGNVKRHLSKGRLVMRLEGQVSETKRRERRVKGGKPISTSIRDCVESGANDVKGKKKGRKNRRNEKQRLKSETFGMIWLKKDRRY